LDIACFFNGLNLKVDHIKLLLKHCESDSSVAVGLERLKDKALVTISDDNVVSMHDIIQEMGREVAQKVKYNNNNSCTTCTTRLPNSSKRKTQVPTSK
jgi:uncharacterized CHY-type Zn-finger protein